MYKRNVTFSVPSGKQYTFREETGRNYSASAEGDAIKVIYLPEDPKNTAMLVVNLNYRNWMYWIGYVITGLLFIVGVASLSLAVRA